MPLACRDRILTSFQINLVHLKQYVYVVRSVVSAVCESVLSCCKPILFADARNQIVVGYCVLTWSGFGEQLEPEVLGKASNELSLCDLCLVVSSLHTTKFDFKKKFSSDIAMIS